MNSIRQFIIMGMLLVTQLVQAQKNNSSFSLREAYSGYLQSAIARDYDALQTYVTKKDSIQFVEVSGTVMLSTDQYNQHIKNWLQDTAWNYRSNIKSLQEYDTYGIIVDSSVFHGTGWEYPMIVTFVFQKNDGYWEIISDICTEVKTKK